MSLGVASGTTGSLQIRKTKGGIEVEKAPDVHEFPRDFLLRELNNAVKLYVVIPSNPPVSYEVSSISEAGETNKLIALQGSKAPLPLQAEEVTAEETPADSQPVKRSWWQRRKN